MPDYLGKDQRKIKDDEKKDDKPIQGASDTLNHTKSRRDLLVTRLTSFSLRLHMETRNHSGLSLKILLSFLPLLALDEGDIEILKTYVSTSKCIDFYAKCTRSLYFCTT